MSDQPLRETLSSVKISDLKRPQAVTILRSSASIDLVLRSLATHRILSAPVIRLSNESFYNENRRGSVDRLRVTSGHGNDDKASAHIAGFVDLNVILNAFMNQIDAQQVSDMKLLQRMRVLEEMGQTFGKIQLQDLNIEGHSGSVILYGEEADKPLLQHLEQGFQLNQEHPRHRIALVDNAGHFTNIISQTDIMKYVMNLPAFRSGIGTRTLSQCNLVSRSVICVAPEISALEALMTMHNNNVSAVAVTNTITNELIGNFSISDLRSIMSEHFGALGLPVGEFLALEHGTEYAGYGNFHEEVQRSQGGQFVMGMRAGQNNKPKLGNDVGQNLAVCTPQSLLGDAVDIMLSRRIHRVYIVEGSNAQLKSVITYTDVLRAILEACQE